MSLLVYFGWIKAKLSKLKTNFHSFTYTSSISIQKDLKSSSRNTIYTKLRVLISVSYFIVLKPLILIENNLIMIFNLSIKSPRRVGISKARGQKGGHINFSLFVALKSVVLLLCSFG